MGYVPGSRQTGPYRVPMAGYVPTGRQVGPYRVPMAGLGDAAIVPTAATAAPCAAIQGSTWVPGMNCTLPDGTGVVYNGSTFTDVAGNPLTPSQLAAIQQPGIMDKLSSQTGLPSTVLIVGAALTALYFLTRK